MIDSQTVMVYQTDSGKQIMRIDSQPVQRAGQNFALSPDGMSLATIHGDAIEIYRLPPLTPKEQTAIKEAQAMAPAANDAPIQLAVPAPTEAPATESASEPPAPGSTPTTQSPTQSPTQSARPAFSPAGKPGSRRHNRPAYDQQNATFYRHNAIPHRSFGPAGQTGGAPQTPHPIQLTHRYSTRQASLSSQIVASQSLS